MAPEVFAEKAVKKLDPFEVEDLNPLKPFGSIPLPVGFPAA